MAQAGGREATDWAGGALLILSPPDYIAAVAIVAAGAAVQGCAGFGMALVAAPLLVLVDLKLVPGPLLLAALSLTLLMSHRERSDVDYRGIRWAVPGRAVGGALGAIVLASLPQKPLMILFGALVLGGVALSVGGARLRLTRLNLVLTGTVSGFIGTITAIGGPPMALLYQDESGPRLRGTLSLYFVVGSVLSMIALTAVGKFGRWEMLHGAALIPGSLAGFWLSGRLRPVVDRLALRPMVLGLSAGAALLVIARALMAR